MELTIVDKKEISTARLDLRPSEDKRDLDRYLSHLKEEDCFLYQYGMHYSEELEEAISFDFGDVIYYSIFLKDTDAMVGYVGILPFEDKEKIGELEFHIFKEFRRNGYGFEAATAIMESFFTGELTGEVMNKITASMIHGNEACQNLLEKLGLEKVVSGLHVYHEHGEEKVVGVCAYEKVNTVAD